jgi:hypothetical protein
MAYITVPRMVSYYIVEGVLTSMPMPLKLLAKSLMRLRFLFIIVLHLGRPLAGQEERGA